MLSPPHAPPPPQRAENWTVALGFKPTQTWRPWTLDSCLRVGGYVTRYEKDRFDFLTIRGSGHMVPQFKPAQALELQPLPAGRDGYQ